MKPKYPIRATDGAQEADVSVITVPAGAIGDTDTIDLSTTVLRAVQTQNAAYTADATLNDTEISFNVEAGTYIFSGIVFVLQGPGGVQCAWGGTATVSSGKVNYKAVISAGTPATDPGLYTNNVATAFDTVDDGEITSISFEGCVIFSAAGTFVFQAAQDASNGSPTTLLPNSSATLTKV